MKNDHEMERDAVRRAIARLLATEGARPTIEDLRRESGVSARWILTHRHADLKDVFVSDVAKKWGSESPRAVAAEAKLRKIQTKYDRLYERVQALERLVDVYAGVIDELTHQLQSASDVNAETLAMSSRTVVRRITPSASQ